MVKCKCGSTAVYFKSWVLVGRDRIVFCRARCRDCKNQIIRKQRYPLAFNYFGSKNCAV